MEKEFLEGLGLEESAVAAILEAHAQEVSAHQQELEQVRFDASLQQAVARAGGRNLTAIRALLDEAALLAAQDREKAIGNALKDLKKTCGYLFDSPAPPAYAVGTGTRQNFETDEPKSLAVALKEKCKKK